MSAGFPNTISSYQYPISGCENDDGRCVFVPGLLASLPRLLHPCQPLPSNQLQPLHSGQITNSIIVISMLIASSASIKSQRRFTWASTGWPCQTRCTIPWSTATWTKGLWCSNVYWIWWWLGQITVQQSENMTHRFLNNFCARFRKGFRKALDGALCRWGHCHDKLLWIDVVTMEDIFLNLLFPMVMSLVWPTFDIQFCPENYIIYLWYWTLLVMKYARLRVSQRQYCILWSNQEPLSDELLKAETPSRSSHPERWHKSEPDQWSVTI